MVTKKIEFIELGETTITTVIDFDFFHLFYQIILKDRFPIHWKKKFEG